MQRCEKRGNCRRDWLQVTAQGVKKGCLDFLSKKVQMRRFALSYSSFFSCSGKGRHGRLWLLLAVARRATSSLIEASSAFYLTAAAVGAIDELVHSLEATIDHHTLGYTMTKLLWADVRLKKTIVYPDGEPSGNDSADFDAVITTFAINHQKPYAHGW